MVTSAWVIGSGRDECLGLDMRWASCWLSSVLHGLGNPGRPLLRLGWLPSKASVSGKKTGRWHTQGEPQNTIFNFGKVFWTRLCHALSGASAWIPADECPCDDGQCHYFHTTPWAHSPKRKGISLAGVWMLQAVFTLGLSLASNKHVTDSLCSVYLFSWQSKIPVVSWKGDI